MTCLLTRVMSDASKEHSGLILLQYESLNQQTELLASAPVATSDVVVVVN